jgi:hypothetical protein
MSEPIDWARLLQEAEDARRPRPRQLELRLQLERPDMLLIEDNGDCYEVDDSDCEESECGTGFYVLTENGEDEEFYEYADEGDYEFSEES